MTDKINWDKPIEKFHPETGKTVATARVIFRSSDMGRRYPVTLVTDEGLACEWCGTYTADGRSAANGPVCIRNIPAPSAKVPFTNVTVPLGDWYRVKKGYEPCCRIEQFDPGNKPSVFINGQWFSYGDLQDEWEHTADPQHPNWRPCETNV